MLYLLYVIGSILAWILPIKMCYLLAEVVARFYFVFATKDKDGIRANLKVVLGEECDEEIINRHTLSVFRNFAKYLADFFKFPRMSEEYINEHIEVTGREHLDKSLADKNGGILLSLHLGNWELGGAVLGGLKYPISAIVLEHSNRAVNNYFIKQRAINNVKSIPVGIKIKECFRALKKNEFLAIVGDKDYTSGGIDVDFFGKKALLPRGPAAFSIKTGSPIIFALLTREANDRFKMRLEGPIEYSPTGDYERDVRGLMKEYVKVFEKYIKMYPDQWYAFRRIWQQEPIIQ